MDALFKLFGSQNRIKLLRFFLMNPGQVHLMREIIKSSKVSKSKAKAELRLLEKIGFIKQAKKGKEKGFEANALFQYNRALRHLIVDSTPVSRELLIRRFKEIGRGIKFVALSGIFIGEEAGEQALDIMIVGDNIRKGKLEKAMSKIQAEVGKELKYVVFDTNEFKYRHSMYDRFVLDVLDNSPDVLIDSLRS